MGRALMLQGTGSHAGKSLLTAALCRIFRQEGLRVAPFKAQNMSLNSFVTADGREIARSQVVQARAAGIEPSADMNPVLLKPKADGVSEVILLGRSIGDLGWRVYRSERREQVLEVINLALKRLLASYDVVVMEGAGSPAEVNLMQGDLSNMKAADLAGAPVLLVGDIDRGGVFASLLGTWEILPDRHRRRLAGVILNKFRGDAGLLDPALEWLKERTGLPTLGVIPYLPNPGLDEEDSVSLEERGSARPAGGADRLEIAVIRFPRISNFTDLEPLSREPSVRLHYVTTPAELANPDAVILPGSKNTVDDLTALYRSGLSDQIHRLAARGVPVVGICGGYQMLGRDLYDPLHCEGSGDPPPGLGLLPVATTFHPEKQTRQVAARWAAPAAAAPWASVLPLSDLPAYEIHRGEAAYLPGAVKAFRLPDGRWEGAVAADGLVWGAQLHGIFDEPGFRRAWLNLLRARRGMPLLPLTGEESESSRQDQAFDRLARYVREHLDFDAVYRLVR
ncbi:MAG: cobyric acid synthase [Thermaerobacterales bacterium]